VVFDVLKKPSACDNASHVLSTSSESLPDEIHSSDNESMSDGDNFVYLQSEEECQFSSSESEVSIIFHTFLHLYVVLPLLCMRRQSLISLEK
jgi:hypothetical protein